MNNYTNRFQREMGGGLGAPVIKTPKERDSLDLLELVCQLHSRALQYPSEEMHNAYVEAKKEMESRLTPLTQEGEDIRKEEEMWSDIIFTIKASSIKGAAVDILRKQYSIKPLSALLSAAENKEEALSASPCLNELVESVREGIRPGIDKEEETGKIIDAFNEGYQAKANNKEAFEGKQTFCGVCRNPYNKETLCPYCGYRNIQPTTEPSTIPVVDMEINFKPHSSVFVCAFTKDNHDSITVNKHDEQIYTKELSNVFVLTGKQLAYFARQNQKSNAVVDYKNEAIELYPIHNNDPITNNIEWKYVKRERAAHITARQMSELRISALEHANESLKKRMREHSDQKVKELIEYMDTLQSGLGNFETIRLIKEKANSLIQQK